MKQERNHYIIKVSNRRNIYGLLYYDILNTSININIHLPFFFIQTSKGREKPETERIKTVKISYER